MRIFAKLCNRSAVASSLAVLVLPLVSVFITPAIAHAATPKHYITNSKNGYSAAQSLGYSLMDVSSKAVMDTLPAGAQGLYWIGNYNNTTCTFAVTDAQVTTIVNNNKTDAKFSGIYFTADEPHNSTCPNAAQDVANRTALVHSLDSNAKTMVTVLDGSNHPGEFQAFANSGDYIAVDPYPCNVNNAVTGCDYNAMTTRINAALQYIPASRIVPVFQLFGQSCATSNFYRLPSVTELKNMLAIWDQKVPTTVRPFDYSYGWGNQTVACPTLVDANGTNGNSDLQTVMSNYFSNMTSVTVTTGAAADSYVALENPSDNFGGQTTTCASKDSSTEESRSLLKFTVSGLSGRTVTSASLNLGVYNGTANTIEVHKVSDQSWTESTVTWGNQPAADSTVVTTVPVTTGATATTIDLKNLITGDGTYTIELVNNSADSFCAYSKESATPPVLTVTGQY